MSGDPRNKLGGLIDDDVDQVKGGRVGLGMRTVGRSLLRIFWWRGSYNRICLVNRGAGQEVYACSVNAKSSGTVLDNDKNGLRRVPGGHEKVGVPWVLSSCGCPDVFHLNAQQL
jgi:hypothetical protein